MNIIDYLRQQLSLLNNEYNSLQQKTASHQNKYNQAKAYYDQCVASPDYLNHPDVEMRNRLKAFIGTPPHILTREEIASKAERAIEESNILYKGIVGIYCDHYKAAATSAWDKIDSAKAAMDECYSKYIYPATFAKKELAPIESSIKQREAEINEILSNIRAIEPVIQRQESLNTQINDLARQSKEYKTKTSNNSQEVALLQNEIEAFKIDDHISLLSENEKAHILCKIWNKNDQDSLTIKKVIIDQGFNPHYASNDSLSFVKLAIETNDLSLFKTLIDNKLDFNHCINQSTLFDYVIKSEKQEFIDIMLNSGECDFAKIIVLNILKNDSDYLSRLLDTVPNWQELKYKEDALLHFAISKGKTGIVETILNKDASIINSANSNGYTALELAIIEQKSPEIKLLEQNGANIKDSLMIRIEHNEEQPIIAILNYCGKEYTDTIIDTLLEKSNQEFLNNIINKCDELLEYSDSGNNNLLHLCCRYGHVELVKVLLDKNADLVNKQNIAGDTPLHIILQNANEESKQQLLNTALSYKPDLTLLNSSNKSCTDLLHDSPLSLAYCIQLGYELDTDLAVTGLGETEENVGADFC
jgi:ankyrin repeat protein